MKLPVVSWFGMQSRVKSSSVSRRQFVAASAIGGVAIAAGCKIAVHGDWEFFTPEEARTLAAICDQVIPADDFPSASQAGVVNYIDRQLARFYRPHRDAYREGLRKARELSRGSQGQALETLTAGQQLQAALQIEKEQGEFFEMVRRHTFEGYYGSPRHGGNRDAVSWRMLGLAEPPLLGRAQYDLRKADRK
jgi:gluconate 2-dehydrogenase gamma chain